MKPTRVRLALGCATCLVALSGCSGGGSNAGASASTEGDTGAGGALSQRQSDTSAATGTDGVAATPVDASTVVEKAVIKNGEIAITTSDPQRARDRVDDLLTRLRGSVDDEQTVYDKQGTIRESTLVLRVPVASFASAMDDLEQLGTVVHSSSNVKDVTTEVIDVQQRLRTLRISLHDLNAFQRRAASIDQLLRFESAITQRRGEYQSLKAQRNHLVDQTAMSTISLDIAVPAAHPAPAPGTLDHAGFVTGLRHGWSALSGTVVVVLTAAGAVLPFALVLALLGPPLWWLGRRVRRVPPAVDAPAAE
jgi:uncharacterized protein DUF4349